MLGAEPEGGVTVCYQEEGIGCNPNGPAHGAYDEIERSCGIAAGEQDDDSGEEHQDHDCQSHENQHNVVRYGQKPLYQGEPAV